MARDLRVEAGRLAEADGLLTCGSDLWCVAGFAAVLPMWRLLPYLFSPCSWPSLTILAPSDGPRAVRCVAASRSCHAGARVVCALGPQCRRHKHLLTNDAAHAAHDMTADRSAIPLAKTGSLFDLISGDATGACKRMCVCCVCLSPTTLHMSHAWAALSRASRSTPNAPTPD